MIRGTTPTLQFVLPFAANIIDVLDIAFSQQLQPYAPAQIVLDKNLSDCTLDGDTISLVLSQEDTLALSSAQDVEIQLRILSNGSALASQIITVPVGRILKDGVLEAEGGGVTPESVYFVPASSANALAGSVSLTLPVPAIQGMSVRFQSPCNSADVEAGIVIDGMSYQWRSVANDDITSLPDLFAVNSVIDIVLDRDNLIAYFIGASPVPPVISFPTANPPANRIPGREYFRVLADFEGGTP